MIQLQERGSISLSTPIPLHPSGLNAAIIKQLFPRIPFLTCINPSNGPGSHFDEKFATGIDSLNKAGILVGGYVATHYGQKPQAEVEKEIRHIECGTTE